MKVSPTTLQWAGLKVQNGSKNLAIVHRRVRDDVEKKMRMKKNGKRRTATSSKIIIISIKTMNEWYKYCEKFTSTLF